MELAESKYKKRYEPILPATKEWPVYQLARNRKNFIEEVTAESLERIKELRPTNKALIEELESTLFREKYRLKQTPWKVDRDDEKVFWRNVQTRLIKINSSRSKKELDEIMEQIISRYSNEIAGNFKRSYYRFARTVVTFGLRRLLNATQIRRFGAVFTGKLTLRDKIHITGETEHIRKLAKIGTVVLVPTHFSNMDSILIGWVIHSLGLPPFIYGAGLNLFNIGILAYFMNSLGAYKVDRRKKNLPYLETLKMYSNLAIQKGCHSLFFPGGTRSRSGSIEQKLKLGLLGTAMEAQRICYAKDSTEKATKVFVVPMVINYHFVLEAPGLINHYLRQKGQERYYMENDQYSSSFNMIKFLLKFITKGSNISVTIGRGMDLLGNYVDEQGNSLDKNNKIIEERDYFMSNGKVVADHQREWQYTIMLGKRIVEEYHRINRVFASHLVAFTGFEILRKRYPNMDLFNFLRVPAEDLVIEYEEFRKVFKRLRKKIFKMRSEGKVNTADHMDGKLDEVIQFGIDNVGMYHDLRPLLKTKSGNIISKDLNTLFYYRNRMEGYGLERFI